MTYVRDLGYFFEPDRRTNILKVCSATTQYTWLSGTDEVSTVPPKLQDSAIISKRDERTIRELLRQSIPSLADRPLQDVGFDGLQDSEEKTKHAGYLAALAATFGVNSVIYQRAVADPSADPS